MTTNLLLLQRSVNCSIKMLKHSHSGHFAAKRLVAVINGWLTEPDATKNAFIRFIATNCPSVCLCCMGFRLLHSRLWCYAIMACIFYSSSPAVVVWLTASDYVYIFILLFLLLYEGHDASGSVATTDVESASARSSFDNRNLITHYGAALQPSANMVDDAI